MQPSVSYLVTKSKYYIYLPNATKAANSEQNMKCVYPVLKTVSSVDFIVLCIPKLYYLYHINPPAYASHTRTCTLALPLTSWPIIEIADLCVYIWLFMSQGTQPIGHVRYVRKVLTDVFHETARLNAESDRSMSHSARDP